jgi:hypothetical protein
MAAIGGPLESVSIDGREFAVAGDADVNRKLGGKENEFQLNGNQTTGRVIQTPVSWKLDAIPLEMDDARGDQEFVQAIASAGALVDNTATNAAGETYQGRGIPTGELQKSEGSTTMPTTLEGPGSLTKQ